MKFMGCWPNSQMKTGNLSGRYESMESLASNHTRICRSTLNHRASSGRSDATQAPADTTIWPTSYFRADVWMVTPLSVGVNSSTFSCRWTSVPDLSARASWLSTHSSGRRNPSRARSSRAHRRRVGTAENGIGSAACRRVHGRCRTCALRRLFDPGTCWNHARTRRIPRWP